MVLCSNNVSEVLQLLSPYLYQLHRCHALDDGDDGEHTHLTRLPALQALEWPSPILTCCLSIIQVPNQPPVSPVNFNLLKYLHQFDPVHAIFA